jgi:hypothetical protein
MSRGLEYEIAAWMHIRRNYSHHEAVSVQSLPQCHEFLATTHELLIGGWWLCRCAALASFPQSSRPGAHASMAQLLTLEFENKPSVS